MQIEYGKYLNLALAQNKCPLITSLKVKNVTAEKMDGLTCRISSPDDFFQTKTVETGPTIGGYTIIFSGLEPGETIIANQERGY